MSTVLANIAQGSIAMHGVTLAEARAELLNQCADDDQIARILAGSIEVL